MMVVLLILLAILVWAALVFGFMVFPAARSHRDAQKLAGALVAHRGLHNEELPENSLPAFENAIRSGYPIEIDIRLTKDGRVVVFHDDTTDRVCGKEGRIADMTLEEVRSLRLGTTFFGVPTLEETLEHVNGRVPLLIEFKCMEKDECLRLCETAGKILETYSGKYYMQSFYPPAVRYYRKHYPYILRGQLACRAEKNGTLAEKMGGCLMFNYLTRPDFISYRIGDTDSVFLRLQALLGALIVGWTYESPDDLDAFDVVETKIFQGFIPYGQTDGEAPESPQE